MRRTIVIGDVHGCYMELHDLLDRVKFAPGADRLIFAGDLIDRGPYSHLCVQLASNYESVLGNHDDRHLRKWDEPERRRLPDHWRTRQQLTEDDREFMRKMPLSIALPEYDAVVVHAGVYPWARFQTQKREHLLHAQSFVEGDEKSHWPSKAPAGARFWAQSWRGPERIIFGHTAIDRPYVSEFAVGIDTGCVYGGSLTALVLPEWDFVSVPARTTYWKTPGVEERPRFEIGSGVRTW